MYAPTPGGWWFVKVRCNCGASEVLFEIIDASRLTMFTFADALKRTGVAISEVDQDFAGQFCECGHDPHTGICGAAEGWDGGAPSYFCECPSYRPDPEDPGP